MIKAISAALILSLSSISLAHAAAPACSDATPINSNSGTLTGDTTATSGGISSIDGDYTLGGNQKVWTFTAGANVDGSFKVTSGLPAWALFVTTGCDATATGRVQSMAIGDFADNTLHLTPALYTAGTTYYVILGALDGLGSPSNGPFSVDVTPNLPVTLQSFSVE